MAKWKFQQIEPQPARGNFEPHMWDDDHYFAEEKYDGDRRIAQFCGHTVRFTGRKKSVKDGLFVEKTDNIPHLSYRAPESLDGTVLDGEIIYPWKVEGGQSKMVTSIMGSKPEEAVRKQQEIGRLQYVVFDCLFFKGEDVRKRRYPERRELAVAALKAWGNPDAKMALQVRKGKREYYEKIVREGGEGVVLKHVDHVYGFVRAWVKVKKQATADVVVMGYKDAKALSKKVNGEISETKYAKSGLVGAVVVGQYNDMGTLEEVATVSGMTDEERIEFTRSGDKYLRRVVVIEHNGREPTMRFRHPRFASPIIFRDDKLARECIMREGET